MEAEPFNVKLFTSDHVSSQLAGMPPMDAADLYQDMQTAFRAALNDSAVVSAARELFTEEELTTMRETGPGELSTAIAQALWQDQTFWAEARKSAMAHIKSEVSVPTVPSSAAEVDTLVAQGQAQGSS